LPVGGHLDLELVALERVAEAADERRLVVHDQDARAQFMSPSFAGIGVGSTEPTGSRGAGSAGAGAGFSVIRTVVPTDFSDSSSISPPRVRTASRAIERPRPKPPSRSPER